MSETTSITEVGTARSGAPARPALNGLEAVWAKAWSEEGTYHYDPTAPRQRVYAIDTPPPTVSGSLHVGHVFSFTHTDTIARYKRMRGYSVFYPMGWDDNGLPTERRVQNYFGVRCDPSLPYEPGFVPPVEGGLPKGQQPLAISRPNFVELCQRLTVEDESAFEEIFRNLGLSVDWRLLYTTIGDKSRRASQRSFLRLLERGDTYAAEAPTLWDVDFRTAVAQAELVDREVAGAYHALAFHRSDGEDLLIDTTRPELLPACVAVVVHPSDDRYRSLVGSNITTPLFGATVRVLAHNLAQPDKGTGAAMVCTFGDITDVTWWRELGLGVRVIIGRDGRLLAAAPDGLSESGASLYTAELGGKRITAAQRRVVELLRDSGELRGEPRPITHAVKYYEKGDRPLEIVSSRQWWIRTLAHKDELLERGRQLSWHPAFMRARYEDWVSGLNSDWLISRQRFFGMPFPVWYRVDQNGDVDYTEPLLAREADLPVDPTTDVPEGFSEDQRDVAGGFTAESDVMDTWATSSLTPQIAGGWLDPEAGDRWGRVFPMDLRPQGHDIIRTWLFATVVRSHLEHGTLPWSNVAISGWILDPDRKKMSKSIGNVVTPQDLLDKHGSDAVRYWAASGRPGMDSAFVEGQMEVGRKLALKILNASKFVLSAKLWVDADGTELTPAGAAAQAAEATGRPGAAFEPGHPGGAFETGAAFEPGHPGGAFETGAAFEPVDHALLTSLGELVSVATRALEDYDYARALERTEAWFWDFCDNYLELVKTRAYGEMGLQRATSARTALATSLSVLLRLFAPFLPFVTEEVWSWWQEGSVHLASWPEAPVPAAPGTTLAAPGTTLAAPGTTLAAPGAPDGPESGGVSVYLAAVDLLGAIRRVKSEAKVGPRSPVARVTFSGSAEQLEALELVKSDLCAAQNVAELVLRPAETASVDVELAPLGGAAP
jgi:valyl-tRNA synthetase